eukprot:5900312-Amphidinium_carterae.1
MFQRRARSDATQWPDEELPAESDNVVIASDECVVLDMTTPVLHHVPCTSQLDLSRTKHSTQRRIKRK